MTSLSFCSHVKVPPFSLNPFRCLTPYSSLVPYPFSPPHRLTELWGWWWVSSALTLPLQCICRDMLLAGRFWPFVYISSACHWDSPFYLCLREENFFHTSGEQWKLRVKGQTSYKYFSRGRIVLLFISLLGSDVKSAPCSSSLQKPALKHK